MCQGKAQLLEFSLPSPCLLFSLPLHCSSAFCFLLLFLFHPTYLNSPSSLGPITPVAPWIGTLTLRDNTQVLQHASGQQNSKWESGPQVRGVMRWWDPPSWNLELGFHGSLIKHSGITVLPHSSLTSGPGPVRKGVPC